MTHYHQHVRSCARRAGGSASGPSNGAGHNRPGHPLSLHRVPPFHCSTCNLRSILEAGDLAGDAPARRDDWHHRGSALQAVQLLAYNGLLLAGRDLGGTCAQPSEVSASHAKSLARRGDNMTTTAASAAAGAAASDIVFF